MNATTMPNLATFNAHSHGPNSHFVNAKIWTGPMQATSMYVAVCRDHEEAERIAAVLNCAMDLVRKSAPPSTTNKARLALRNIHGHLSDQCAPDPAKILRYCEEGLT